ncbi:MAG: hypothetical protein AAF004_01775 [Pseudomonadota bacterium]
MSQRYDHRAAALQLTRSTLATTPWTLAVFDNQAMVDPHNQLHVYLEGDGTPWHANVPSADPTPRRPIALELVAADPYRAVLLGRPCYHGEPPTPHCSQKQWTSQRYSVEVVDSLAQATRSLMQGGDFNAAVLIGYSGGGTLAHMVATRLEHVAAVITVGANLDTDAWTAHHNYLSLTGSVNPTRSDRLDSTIRQWHYIGANDTVVPPQTRAAFFDRHTNANNAVIEGFGHVCCWVTDWPTLLERALKTAP